MEGSAWEARGLHDGSECCNGGMWHERRREDERTNVIHNKQPECCNGGECMGDKRTIAIHNGQPKCCNGSECSMRDKGRQPSKCCNGEECRGGKRTVALNTQWTT